MKLKQAQIDKITEALGQALACKILSHLNQAGDGDGDGKPIDPAAVAAIIAAISGSAEDIITAVGYQIDKVTKSEGEHKQKVLELELEKLEKVQAHQLEMVKLNPWAFVAHACAGRGITPPDMPDPLPAEPSRDTTHSLRKRIADASVLLEDENFARTHEREEVLAVLKGTL